MEENKQIIYRSSWWIEDNNLNKYDLEIADDVYIQLLNNYHWIRHKDVDVIFYNCNVERLDYLNRKSLPMSDFYLEIDKSIASRLNIPSRIQIYPDENGELFRIISEGDDNVSENKDRTYLEEMVKSKKLKIEKLDTDHQISIARYESRRQQLQNDIDSIEKHLNK